MSRLITNAIRSTSASSDAITLDGSGNVVFPANATCSGTASGFGGGKVIQMKHKLSSTQVSTSSKTAYTIATDLNLSITPTSATNLILGMFTLHMVNYTNGTADTVGEVAVTDDDQSTYLFQQRIRGYDYGNSGTLLTAVMGGNHVKVAGNTNARTYKVAIKNITGSGNAFGTVLNSTPSNLSSVVLMEIEPST